MLKEECVLRKETNQNWVNFVLISFHHTTDLCFLVPAENQNLINPSPHFRWYPAAFYRGVGYNLDVQSPCVPHF